MTAVVLRLGADSSARLWIRQRPVTCRLFYRTGTYPGREMLEALDRWRPAPILGILFYTGWKLNSTQCIELGESGNED